MEGTIFEKIEQRTIQHEAVDLIRAAIVSGKLELGQHLAENSLADQMAVSRIPIREALRQLEQEGLVIRVPNKGCWVIDFQDEDVDEVFSLRATLECMAIEWAIPNLSPEDISELRNLIEQQHQTIMIEDYNHLAYLDMKFHEYICIKANHRRLLQSWYAQHAQCQILLNRRFRILPSYTPKTVVNDHALILQAIEQKDVQTAMQLTRSISERVVEECKEVLRRIHQKKV